MKKRGWVLWLAQQFLFAFGFPAFWHYVLKDCSLQGQSLGAHFCSSSWHLSITAWPRELEQVAVKSHYENWQQPIYWLDMGIRYILVVLVKSSFFPLRSCAGITATARSVGCPCLLCVGGVSAQCSQNTKFWWRSNSPQCRMLDTVCCWRAKAGRHVPGRLLPPVSVSPPLGQGLSPNPLGFSGNVDYFSPAAAEWDIFSAGINWLSFTYQFLGQERGPGPGGLIFSLLSTHLCFLRNEAFLCA